MRSLKTNHQKLDVILIYQERDMVEGAIKQIQDLELNFSTVAFDVDRIHDVIAMQPKVVLLSSNNVANTIKFYVEYLEEYEGNVSPHSAILLINNKESPRAYLACENGLFDNYAIINPLNEPFRLKLVLLQALELIEDHKNNSIEQLVDEGEEELAGCITHGVNLKKSFQQQVNICEESIADAARVNITNEARSEEMQRIVELTFQELNHNISEQIQSVLDHMVDVKLIHSTISAKLAESALTNKFKPTTVGVNVDGLLTRKKAKVADRKSVSYKLLIAEHSELFIQVIEEMFEETKFNYVVTKDGEETLAEIINFKPDVVLLSYDLPKVNGMEVTRRVRSMGNKVPIVAFSQHKDKSFIGKWIPLGLSGYIIKPSKKSTIIQTVTKAAENPIEVLGHTKGKKVEEIIWLPEYSVGHEVIDEQHKMLFTLINDFFKSSGKESVLVLFDSLSSYIQLHFHTEEELLKQIKYPRTIQHIEKHRVLTEKFCAMQERLDVYDEDIHHKIALFLYRWLAKHILKADMDYKKYALKQQSFGFKQTIRKVV